MSIKKFLPVYRLFFAVLAFVAVLTQLIHGATTSYDFSATNFFSFFTIDSNLLALFVFAVTAFSPRDSRLNFLRGAATLYMVVTGLVYSLLLANADVQTPLPWVNATLHYIFPLAILLDWLIDPGRNISFKKALWWLVFPLVWLAYTLIRGANTHWYPYPFLNVDKHGYSYVSISCAAIAVAFVVLVTLLVRVPRLVPKR